MNGRVKHLLSQSSNMFLTPSILPARWKSMSFLVLISVALPVLVGVPHRAGAGDFSERSVADHLENANRVSFERGEVQKQLRIGSWEPGLVLDLRGVAFHMNENTKFPQGKPLPDVVPSRQELKAMGRAPYEERYALVIQDKSLASRDVFVYGGDFVSMQHPALVWRVVKSMYTGDAIHVRGSGHIIVDGVKMFNVEDGFSPRGDAYWIIRNAYARDVRDDFVENDGLLAGEIRDCLVDGAFVFLSSRPGREGKADPTKMIAANKRKWKDNVVLVENTLVHCRAYPWDGDAKGEKLAHAVDGKVSGNHFKWDTLAGKLVVRNCIFMIDTVFASGVGAMEFPENGVYENNTIVWLGEGAYPARVPDGTRVTEDRSVWESARAGWFRRHGIVPAELEMKYQGP